MLKNQTDKRLCDGYVTMDPLSKVYVVYLVFHNETDVVFRVESADMYDLQLPNGDILRRTTPMDLRLQSNLPVNVTSPKKSKKPSSAIRLSPIKEKPKPLDLSRKAVPGAVRSFRLGGKGDGKTIWKVWNGNPVSFTLRVLKHLYLANN